MRAKDGDKHCRWMGGGATLKQRLWRQVSPGKYWTSYRWPSMPPRKMRPSGVEATLHMTTLSEGKLYSGNGCSVTSPKGSPCVSGLQHMPSSTTCTLQILQDKLALQLDIKSSQRAIIDCQNSMSMCLSVCIRAGCPSLG